MISLLRKNSGFRKIIRDFSARLRDGELQLVAGSLSFSTILALVPFIAVVLATLKIVGGGFEAFYPQVERIFLHNLRDTAGIEAARAVRDFLNNISAGKVGTTGAIFLILTSLRLLHEMEKGINRVWNHENSRPFYRRLIFYWLLILSLPFGLAFYVTLSSLEEVTFITHFYPKILNGAFLVWLGLLLVFKFVPDVSVKWRAVLISASATAIVLLCAQKVLSWATLQLFNYNKIYGSFAAVPILLIWILTTWYIILGGVIVCATLHNRKA